jgi:hypothetical protein
VEGHGIAHGLHKFSGKLVAIRKDNDVGLRLSVSGKQAACGREKGKDHDKREGCQPRCAAYECQHTGPLLLNKFHTDET